MNGHSCEAITLPLQAPAASLEAASMPSIHGSSFFAQWSVCRMTGIPYCSAIARTWYAPETAPAIAALKSLLSIPLPA